METCKIFFLSKKIVIIFLFFLLFQSILSASTFDDLKKNKKISYLDFILLKIESRIIQRHALLRSQPITMRVQYQTIVTEIKYVEKDSKIIISITGVMDKKRYTKKKYRPKISDCNILRNILLYGKYGYNLIFQKRNKHLTIADMENIFISRFLNNLSLSDNEKNYIIENTLTFVEVIDTVRGNDIFCKGNVARDLI
jgi:hypothetical protein|tara:strand:+ start:33 stop:623 length:591 start_codon:yes stop_codon:yes gene_type:complete